MFPEGNQGVVSDVRKLAGNACSLTICFANDGARRAWRLAVGSIVCVTSVPNRTGTIFEGAHNDDQIRLNQATRDLKWENPKDD